MKTRTIVGALLALALAAPVAATVGGFPDVPEDHPRAAAIRYAAERELFLGFPDGNLRPDAELTRTQFVKVSERLYDSADAWTRSDWAQVMYAGVPSLESPPVSPATTSEEGSPTTAAAANIDISLRCGWPLGDVEPVLPLPASGPPREIRFPVTPCAPPVTYRIEFRESSAAAGQTLNLPYTSASPDWTPAITWRTNASTATASVKVTEFRPGGPVSGRSLGEIWVAWRAIRERTPTTPASTIPPVTSPPATTAPTTTTTRPPTVTVPPPEPVVEVPFDERDVVIHWFIHPGSDEEGDTPLFGMYVADPDGPIPLAGRDGNVPSATIWPLTQFFTEDGEGDVSLDIYGLGIYGSRSSGHAFGPRTYLAPEDVVSVEMGIAYAAPDRNGHRAERHPFASVTFVEVVPPSEECLPAWRWSSGRGVWGRSDCHPSEWDRWWGVRATHRAEDS